MAFAVNDAQRSAKRFVQSTLKQLGIELEGRVRMGRPEGRFDVEVASHHSQPLPELLKPVLEKSDNIYSDSLLKTMGVKSFHAPGSYYSGAKAMRQALEEQGVDISTARLVDGSGLSRYNHISARGLTDILALSLSLWGEEAPWLKAREKNTHWVKSGTMSGVNNLVGIVFPPEGKEPLLFSVMINGLWPESPEDKQAVRAFYKELRGFYKDFVGVLSES